MKHFKKKISFSAALAFILLAAAFAENVRQALEQFNADDLSVENRLTLDVEYTFQDTQDITDNLSLLSGIPDYFTGIC